MSEIRYLLPNVKRYFKTAMHTHSSLTDARPSPAEIKQAYKDMGYSIVAYSDHGLITKNPDLNDEDFLALTSYEMDFTEVGEIPQYCSTYHFNAIAKDPDNLWQAYYPKRLFPNIAQLAPQVTFGEHKQICTVENINRIIADTNAHGFLVTYNHPSNAPEAVFLQFEGLWGLEVYNHDSWACGNDEINHRIYQTMLQNGKRVFPIASDDCHSTRLMNFGWIMLGAEKLSYDSVISALEKGDFYASTGPEIHSLTLEGNILKITCSEAKRISLHSHCRFHGVGRQDPGGALLTEKEFDLSKWFEISRGEHAHEAFFYISVDDAYGHHAWTRPFWFDELV